MCTLPTPITLEHTTWEKARELCQIFTDYNDIPYDLGVFETQDEAEKVMLDYKAEVLMFNSEDIKYKSFEDEPLARRQLGFVMYEEIEQNVRLLRIQIQHINPTLEMGA